MTLDKLPKSKRATVTGFREIDPALEAKLREIGFAEGDEIALEHCGPLGARPLCYRLNQTLIALRPDEASLILIEMTE